jgi:hypothetical protein
MSTMRITHNIIIAVLCRRDFFISSHKLMVFWFKRFGCYICQNSKINITWIIFGWHSAREVLRALLYYLFSSSLSSNIGINHLCLFKLYSSSRSSLKVNTLILLLNKITFFLCLLRCLTNHLLMLGFLNSSASAFIIHRILILLLLLLILALYNFIVLISK